MSEKFNNGLKNFVDSYKDLRNFKNEDPKEDQNDNNNIEIPIRKPQINRRPPLLDPYDIDKVIIPFERPKSPPKKEGNA